MPLALKVFCAGPGSATLLAEHVLEGDRITVGRSADCTLSLDDPDRRLSRVHLEFRRTGRGYRLKVASTHASVTVNGAEHLPGSEVSVHQGDRVTMDVYTLEIADPGPVAVPAPLAPQAAVGPVVAKAANVPGAVKLGAGAAMIAAVLASLMFWPGPAPQAPSIPVAVAPKGPPARAGADVAEDENRRRAFERATDAARACIAGADFDCAQVQLAEMKKQAARENPEDAKFDLETVAIVSDSMEHAKKLAADAGGRKPSVAGERFAADRRPAPASAGVAPKAGRADPLSAYALCMTATYGVLKETFPKPVEAAARARLACGQLRANLERDVRARAGAATSQVMRGVDGEILRTLRLASK